MHPSSPAPPVLTPQREPAFERRTVTFSTQNKVVKTVPNLVEIVESIKMPSPLTEATPTLQAADIADIAEIDPETDIAVKSDELNIIIMYSKTVEASVVQLYVAKSLLMSLVKMRSPTFLLKKRVTTDSAVLSFNYTPKRHLIVVSVSIQNMNHRTGLSLKDSVTVDALIGNSVLRVGFRRMRHLLIKFICHYNNDTYYTYPPIKIERFL